MKTCPYVEIQVYNLIGLDIYVRMNWRLWQEKYLIWIEKGSEKKVREIVAVGIGCSVVADSLGSSSS